jgi:DNA-binding Xre family transcriptional regulator
MSDQIIKADLEWRLNVVMSERRIKTITELKRRLDAIDVHISSAQLGRVVWERPQKINIDLLEGLVTVLDCDVSEILRKSGASDNGKDRRKAESVESTAKQKDTPKEPRLRVKPVLVSSSENVTGPKLTAIPLPERKK